MIRINLLGQARPKATMKAVPLEAPVQVVFGLVALTVAFAILGITYYQQKSQLDKTNARISSLRTEKASLEQIKQEVDRFEAQKTFLQQRIDVIETLQRNRSGGQDAVAVTFLHEYNGAQICAVPFVRRAYGNRGRKSG